MCFESRSLGEILKEGVENMNQKGTMIEKYINK